MSADWSSNYAVNTGVGRNSASFSHTYSAEATNNRIVLVCTKSRGNPGRTSTAVTYAGLSMTAVTNGAWSYEYTSGIWFFIKWWWVAAPTSGSNYTVAVTYAGTTSSDEVFVVTAYNVNMSAPTGATNSATGSGATPSVNLTTTAAGSFILSGAMMRRASGETWSVGAGESGLADGETGTAANSDFTYVDMGTSAAAVDSYTLSATNGTSSVQWLIGAIEVMASTGIISATATDGWRFTETTARRAVYRKTAADTLAAAETRTPRRVRRPVVTDGLGLTEVRTPRRVLRATVTESMGLAATMGRKASFRAAPVDLLKLLETALRGGRVVAAASDGLDVTDTAAPGYHIRRVAADTWRLTPNATRRADYRVTVADAVDLSEAATYPLPSESGTVDNLIAYEDSSQGSDGVINIGNNESSVRATNPYNALEFRDLDVPRYAIPTVAYISLYTVTADDPGLTIRAQDTASPAALSTTANDISSRSPLTTAAVEWSAANIGLGAYKQSPDLSPIFEELFALPEWTRGASDVVLRLADNGTGGHLRYQTSEGSNKPKLYIEWYLGGLTITATAADALKVMDSAARRAIIAAATADALGLATATTTTAALLVADDLHLTDMVGTLARLSIADALAIGDGVFLTYAMTLTETVDLYETLQRIAALRAASVDALDYVATARTKINTAAGDAIDFTDALVARRILAAVAADALRYTLITTGDMAGVLEAIATDALDLSAVANAGWRTRAAAVDSLDATEALTAVRRFVGLAHDAGAIDDIAAALKRARATAADAAGFADALRVIMRTRAVDLLELSETALAAVAAILHALAADVLAYDDGAALNWQVTARDNLEFVAAVGSIMHWIETVQDALGLHGAAVYLLPSGIVRVEFAINGVTVHFDVAMPGVETTVKQPTVTIAPHGLIA